MLNKAVVITGAASGLGCALARELHRNGCHLALIDLDQGGLERLRQELGSTEQRVTIYRADVADEVMVKEVGEKVLADHGRIDMLINNAAISHSLLFEEFEMADFRRLFEVNFWGVVYCSRYFLPHLKREEGSRLVNVISGFALMGFPGKTGYCSSKSAVMGFTNVLKTELAGGKVKVCLVIPPPMNTGIVRSGKHINEVKRSKEMAFLERRGMPLDEVAGRIVRQIKRGRYRIVVGAGTWVGDVVCRLFPTLVHYFIGKRKKKIDFV